MRYYIITRETEDHIEKFPVTACYYFRVFKHLEGGLYHEIHL